jgi:hypothetical protein
MSKKPFSILKSEALAKANADCKKCLETGNIVGAMMCLEQMKLIAFTSEESMTANRTAEKITVNLTRPTRWRRLKLWWLVKRLVMFSMCKHRRTVGRR